MLNKPSVKISLLAVLMALSLVLSYLESLISFGFVFPGFKIGLSNIAVLIILYLYGSKFAVPFGLVKSFLSLLFLGRLSSLVFSLCGMALSLIIMSVMKKTKKFSIYSVSICGSVFHIWGQIISAALFFYSTSVFMFLPWLSLLATVSGGIVAFLSEIIVKSLEKS